MFDNPCHYSGNFWWSKSSYIKRLSSCGNLTYNDPEFWLTRNENGKYVSLWNSNCSVLYHELYEKEKYINQVSINLTVSFLLYSLIPPEKKDKYVEMCVQKYKPFKFNI